jgi:hypothetical protein
MNTRYRLLIAERADRIESFSIRHGVLDGHRTFKSKLPNASSTALADRTALAESGRQIVEDHEATRGEGEGHKEGGDGDERDDEGSLRAPNPLGE